MPWLNGLSAALTAGTQGAAGYLEGQQKGRKEEEERMRQTVAALRQKHIDEQNAILQSARIGDLQAAAQARLAPKPAEPFTLGTGQRRYNPDGTLIAKGAEDIPSPNNYGEVARHNKAMEALAAQRAAQVGTGTGRPPTDSQRKAQALLMTAEQANELLRGFGTGKAPPRWLNQQASKVGLGLGNVMSPSEYQRMKQAALQLSDAWLRYTSGAAVPESEVERFAQSFLPVAGDKSETMVQKLKARETIIRAMRMGAGSATPDAAAAVQDYVLPNSRED